MRGHSEEPNLPYRLDQGEGNDGRRRAGLPSGSCVLLGHLQGAVGCEPRPGPPGLLPLRSSYHLTNAVCCSEVHTPHETVARIKTDASFVCLSSPGGCKPIRGAARAERGPVLCSVPGEHTGTLGTVLGLGAWFWDSGHGSGTWGSVLTPSASKKWINRREVSKEP